MRIAGIALSILSVLAAFFFPWPFTVVLAGVASLFVPPMAFVVGSLIDFLYFSGTGFPYFIVLGLIVTGIAYYVQSFIKTRIM